jgi:hypothetical protein
MAVGIAAAILLAGCGMLFGKVAPQGVAEPAVDGAPLVTDCEPPFAFEGETTLAELGIENDVGTGEETRRRATIRITRDFVTHAEFAPPGVPNVPAGGGQMLCVTWDDGSSMATLLSQPFAGDVPVADDDQAATEGGVPLAGLLVGLAILIVAAVSWLAFRREPAPG